MKTCLHFHGEAATEVHCQLDERGEEERQDPGHTDRFHLPHCYIATLLHTDRLLHCTYYIDRLHFLHSVTKIAAVPSATAGKSFGRKWTESDEGQRKRTEAEQKVSKCSVLSSVFIQLLRLLHLFRLLHLLHLSLITCLTGQQCAIVCHCKMYVH